MLTAVTQQSTRVRGLNSGWIELGLSTNPILFMIHGYPDSPLVWEHQTRYFSDRFQVVCPFVRGVGPSENGKLSRYGLSAQSLDFLQMLREIDPAQKRKVVLIGHDLGAVHAWHLASLLGRRLQSLVIFNGLHLLQMLKKLKSPEQHLRSWYIYLAQVPWLADWLIRKIPRTLSGLAYQFGKLPKDLQPDFSPDALAEPINQYRAFLRDIPRFLITKTKPIDAPVLVVWGEKDPFVKKISADEFAPFARDVTFRFVPRGHWHFRENPEETNQLLEKFFNEQ